MASCSSVINIAEAQMANNEHSAKTLRDESPLDHDIEGWCMLHQKISTGLKWKKTSTKWNWHTGGKKWSPAQKTALFHPKLVDLVPCGSQFAAQLLLQEMKVFLSHSSDYMESLRALAPIQPSTT